MAGQANILAFDAVQDGGITYAALITNFLAASLNSETIGDFVQLVAYDGFDPAAIHALLAQTAAAKGRPLISDIMKMIALTITRGTMISKMGLKSSVEARNLINTMRTDYGISDNLRTRTGRGGVVITLGRVCSTYPHLSARMMDGCPSLNPSIPLSHLNTISLGYPKVLTAPGVVGLMLSLSVFNKPACHTQLKEAILLYQILFSRLVTKKTEPTMTVSAMKMRATKIIDASVGARALLNSDRATVLLETGILIAETVDPDITVDGRHFNLAACIGIASRAYQALETWPLFVEA